MKFLRVVSIGISLALLIIAPATSAAKEERGKASNHRSELSKVVEDLKTLAGKDFDVGAEVGEVAKNQEEANEDASEALEAIENRGGLKTFLFGTDYKNIGVLRSTLITTGNSINRLEKAMERATTASVKANLQAQIDVLKEAQEDIEGFIEENEDRVSLFGWFTKYFQ